VITKVLAYVVDDEVLLGQIVEAILRKAGHEVKRFSDPAAALEALKVEPCKPALLVTDYAMQPFNGLELIARCRENHPALRSLLVSGNARDDIPQLEHSKPDAFLNKPFLPKRLLQEVGALLEPKAQP
jgi:DNA-binding NtrC family response regulator